MTLVGHSCVTLWWDTFVGLSSGMLLCDTLSGALVGLSGGTLLCDTLVGHSCRHSHEDLLWDALV